MSKYYKKKVKEINNITVKVKTQADLDMELQDRLDMQDKIVAKLQRMLTNWWSHQTKKQFILIVDYGNLDKGKSTMNYKIELTQLCLDKETIDRFTDGVKEKVQDFLNNLAQYL